MNDMTQQAVAGAAGISREYYSDIERGKRKASLSVCCKISEVLGLTPEQAGEAFLGKEDLTDGKTEEDKDH